MPPATTSQCLYEVAEGELRGVGIGEKGRAHCLLSVCHTPSWSTPVRYSPLLLYTLDGSHIANHSALYRGYCLVVEADKSLGLPITRVMLYSYSLSESAVALSM